MTVSLAKIKKDVLVGQVWEFVVTDAVIYHDAYCGNASDWRKVETIPGVYPVEFTTIDGGEPWQDGEHGRGSRYYGVVKLPVRELESGGTNRLFTATSNYHHDHGGRVGTHYVRDYAYNYRPNRPYDAEGDWRLRRGECPAGHEPGNIMALRDVPSLGGFYRVAS